MSKSVNKQSRQERLKQRIRSTYEPNMKTRQALDAKGVLPADQHGRHRQRHNDGSEMFRDFEMSPFYKHLESAARREHAAAEHPQALAHLVTHIEKWEKWEIKSDNPDLEDVSDHRKRTLEWFREDPERMRRMRTGGTDCLIHGEQGTTKTTFLHWLVTTIMQINQRENVLWFSTLDDVEWATLARYATVALPEGVETRLTVEPYRKRLSTFEISIEDICRDVIRYSDPKDLTSTLADRTPGQFYVVYPDPEFRKCESITNRPYFSLFDSDVESSTDATPLSHWWFALHEQLVHGVGYGEWTTEICDEAQKWLHQRASSDEHEWWEKVQDWATTHGDARKQRVSAFLAIHQWEEAHADVKAKMRWGATMNGEPFPSKAPISGMNSHQDLGETCVWSRQKWNEIGYKDMKEYVSVPADFTVEYPQFEEVKNAKSR